MDRSSVTTALDIPSQIWNYLADLRVVDLWREKHPEGRDYTFYSAHRQSYSKIDMIWSSINVLSQTKEISIGNRIYSDHAPVIMEWGYRAAGRQSSWRLNNWLLEAKGLKEVISVGIKDFFDINLGSTNLITVWETFKAYIRGEFIPQTAFRNKLMAKTRMEMVQRIKNLEQEHKQMGGQDNWALLQKEMDDLRMLDEHIAAADIMYANQKWFEFRDKSNRMLARSLEEHSYHKLVNKMRMANGTMTMNPVEKSNSFAAYYETLYASSSPPPGEVEGFGEKLDTPQLTQEDQEKLDAPVQLTEIARAINSLKLNKSPGNDRLTVKFYRKFQDQLVAVLQQLFSECILLNTVPSSWLEARITVIPKPDKELSLPQDYRPISLLNVDYKIFMTIMANRLNEIIGSYIHQDQAGFLGGGYRKDKLRQILNILAGLMGVRIPLFCFLGMLKKRLTGWSGSFKNRCLRK